MKIICSRESLLEGVNIVQKAVSTKTTLPILEGIFIEASEGFKLTGNDLEIGIECFVEADIIEKGSVVLNSRLFGDIVRRLPEAEVLIETIGENLILIECENSRFEIKGISSSGYPMLPEVERNNAFTIDQELIRDMIRQTVFAVSIDEYRPVLTGSLLEYKNGELTIVSIDGFRLALRKNSVEGETHDFSVVIPGKTLNEIIKILQPDEDKVSIYSTRNQILFDIGKCKIVSRILEGEYLNYENIIPKEYETTIVAGTKNLLSSIERASLIITAEERKYPVKITIADDMAVITSNTDIGTVREEIGVEMEGNNMDIGFNPRYLIEALKVIDEEKIRINFTSSIGPCIIKPLEGDSFTYLVLPIRK